MAGLVVQNRAVPVPCSSPGTALRRSGSAFAGRPWRKLDSWMGLIWEDHMGLELLRCLGRCCSNSGGGANVAGPRGQRARDREALPGCLWQGNVPALQAKGLSCSSVSMCVPAPCPSTCCSCASFHGHPWVWHCPPLQLHIFLRGGRLLALPMEEGASESGIGGGSISVSPVCHCPRVLGFGFAAGGPRQHMVKHSALTKPPKDILLSWSHLVTSPVGSSECQTQWLHVPWECQALQSPVLFTECCCSINLCDWLVISVITN